MFNILKRLLNKSRRLKRTDSGHVVANRQGIDEKPNEPFGCEAPPIRIEDKELYLKKLERVKSADN
jgi:hypothetical protein